MVNTAMRFGVSLGLLILVPLAGCEPADEGPPPQAPPGASWGPPGPPPGDPAAGPAPALAPAPAPAEYTLGEDTDSYDDNDPSALTDFHAALDPVGTWVDDQSYGTVWVPSQAAVGADFTPYSTAGHWVYDNEWVWASDYPWGWAPFHYGRWVMAPGRGWAWIPGRAYRGAWVDWAVNDGYTYVGWTPMPPAFLWFGGVAVGWGGFIGPSWVYCPRGEIFSPAVGARVVSGPAAAPIAVGMRSYVTATPGVAAGPSPQRLGFTAAQTPHPAGSTASSLQRAQAFARPSTAQPLGAHAATPVTAPVARTAVSGSTFSSTRPSITTPSRAAESSPHAATPGGVHVPSGAPATGSAHTAPPASRSSGWHGGGGGGGHHR